MKRRLLCVMLAGLLLGSSLSACGSAPAKNKYTTQSFDYFDTVSIITGYAESQEAFDEVAEEILTQLGQYHRLYSIYHRFDGMENLCTVNEVVDGAHRTVPVDRRIIDLLLYAKELYATTKGRLHIAMGSVLSLWHDYRTVGKDNPAEAALPPMAQLQAAAEHMDLNQVRIDEKNNTVTLTDPLMKLDVGAIAKGYATERIARSLEERGLTGYVLNIGGNVRTVGAKPDGTPWTVGIENADNTDFVAYLQLEGESVVTSGSYQRYYTVDGKRYHHIIHPDTLQPAEGYVSVSVVCKDSGLADGLSTALFCMPQAEGLVLVESLPGVEALWIATDGTRTVSAGWTAYTE